MKAWTAAGLVMVLAGLAACAAESIPTPAPRLPQATPQGALASVASNLPSERLIVRTATIELVVDSTLGAIENIAKLAGDVGGYVVSSARQGDEEARISFRVPVEHFDEAIRALRAMAVRVVSEDTKSQDVTEEYSDLGSRLRNLEATEREYLRLLEKAQTISEMLSVQSQLSSVRGEIERTQGRLQLLERTSAMSLIEVRLTQTASARPVVSAGWSPRETFRAAAQSLIIALRALADIGIWVLLFAPLWLPLALLGLFLGLREKRRKKL